MDGLLEQMARLIQDAFDYCLVEIGLVEAPDLVFKTRAIRDGEGPFESFHLPVDEASITGWVAATGQSLLVPDVSQERRYVKVTGTVTVDDLGPLPEDVHVAFYRIAQEALNNVVKHAQVDQVTVSLRGLDDDDDDSDQFWIELTIYDNGRGFDIAQVPAERLGLGIIRGRAQAIDADLKIESSSGQGTRITVVWNAQR